MKPPFTDKWNLPPGVDPAGGADNRGGGTTEVDFAPLDARRIDLANPPPKPIPVLSLNGQQISTSGNLTVISAQAKAGKSATVGAMLASVILGANETEGADCLGFHAHPHNGKAVILFDTEQSPYDSHKLVERAARRAGGVTALPKNFRLYRLLDISTHDRRTYLVAEMERASKECDGIHSVLIDGIADLCVDPNNGEEAFALVEQLVKQAVAYDCPMVVVLHENPFQQGGGPGKTRGHLGSHLERKAESNLHVAKDGEASIIYSEKCRSANIPKHHGTTFAWSDTAGMHVTQTSGGALDPAAKKREEQQPVCDAVFEGVTGPLTWNELMGRLESARVKGRTAERRINKWVDLGLITKGTTGYFRP